ncbi:hypothetical protein PILCRDRAFT_15823 [Piloderma croceum F 1598]|uniref:CCHC-type domain-containing protein n=1 Tax=Piloderma croceum (strain F 1598) TaxID=765440 RepID=A0A0C3B625_PILCF|nr:hypothetical protein PILCRDRAFT_15823 [Piloderma croceum F 1598]
MYSRRSSPNSNNPNMSSGYTPPDDQTSMRDQQNPISSIPCTDSPVAPRPLAISHEGPSPFVSATSHIPLEGPIERTLRARTPPEGSDHKEVSPSPHREGQPLMLSNPPSQNVSHAEGATINIGPPPSSDIPRGSGFGGNPASVSTESSITPMIQLAALDGLLTPEQSSGIKNLISHHALQRQKLASAGLNQVVADTVQLLLKGENILAAISKAFERPPSHGGPSLVGLPVEGRLPYGQSYEDNYPPEESMGNPPIPTNIVGEDSTGSCRSDHNGNEVLQDTIPSSEGNDPQDHRMPIYNPSSLVRGILEREFMSQQADETDSQYENRYLAHQRCINNTQQSWARSGYDLPPHLDSVSTNIRRLEHRFGRGMPIPIRRQAPTTGCLQLSVLRVDQFRDNRDGVYVSQHKAQKDQRVQFGELPDRQNQETQDNYLDGHNGISAYRVSQGPPNKGLWNTEQYHYTVMLKRIRRLIHWKVGMSITAPPGSKQPKMGEPHKYSGNRNHNVFLQWLNQFLNWLRSHYYCGDKADPSRLNLLGNYVEGIAADWYAADVDNPDKMTMEPMRFIDAVCAMHQRFVRTATANNAVTQYNRVEYSPSEGVEGFYYRLDKMASCMIECPSDYSFRLRLYEGLPAWIYDTLLERNILPKFCTLEDIWENARQIEELSLRAQGNFRGSSATSLLKWPQNEPQRGHSSMKPRASPSGGFKPFRPNNNIRSSSKRPSDVRPNNVRTFTRLNPTMGRSNIQPSRGQGHSSGSPRQVKPEAPRADQGPRDNKLVECYCCHQIGHIATDTKCPQHPLKTGRPQFNAQRLIEDEAEGEEEVQEEHPEDHDNLQDVNSWGGSQYDPKDEGD